jgi:hypothetical protein
LCALETNVPSCPVVSGRSHAVAAGAACPGPAGLSTRVHSTRVIGVRLAPREVVSPGLRSERVAGAIDARNYALAVADGAPSVGCVEGRLSALSAGDLSRTAPVSLKAHRGGNPAS